MHVAMHLIGRMTLTAGLSGYVSPKLEIVGLIDWIIVARRKANWRGLVASNRPEPAYAYICWSSQHIDLR